MNHHHNLSFGLIESEKSPLLSRWSFVQGLHSIARFVIVVCFLFALTGSNAFAQELKLVETGKKTSLRGLSVINEKVIWASGSRGMVARSVDGGLHFVWNQVPGFEQRDFRDVEAFDAQTALIMAIDTPAIILKTTDGGISWKKVFEDLRPGMFLDAMAFLGKAGYVVGDPINGKAFLAQTNDGGENWQESEGPELESGEAFFASSGSNIVVLVNESLPSASKGKNPPRPIFVSGGMQSRLFGIDMPVLLPMRSGKNSSGANGLALSPDGKSGILFGGDFAAPLERDSSMLLFGFDGKNIRLNSPLTPPFGYKSHVVFINSKQLVATGTSGIDLSLDGGLTWKHFSDLPFHVSGAASDSDKVWFAGPNGTIAFIFKKDALLK